MMYWERQAKEVDMQRSLPSHSLENKSLRVENSGLLSHASSLCSKVSSHAGRGCQLSIFADNLLDKFV